MKKKPIKITDEEWQDYLTSTAYNQGVEDEQRRLVGKLPTEKDLSNKILRCLANKYPRKRHCSHIEEELCDACEEKLIVARFVLDEILKLIKAD